MQTATLGHYLFLNLRSIVFEIHSWDLVPFLRLLLNPELVSVHVEFPNNNPRLHRPATISLIPTRALTHLRLAATKNGDFPQAALHHLLDRASKTLRSVILDGELSVAVAQKLLQLPNLRYLEAVLPRTRISPSAVAFPSLEELVATYDDAGSWLHLLQNIPNPTLRELEVTFSGSSPVYLQALGSSLLGANTERTLTSFKCLARNGIPDRSRNPPTPLLWGADNPGTPLSLFQGAV